MTQSAPTGTSPSLSVALKDHRTFDSSPVGKLLNFDIAPRRPQYGRFVGVRGAGATVAGAGEVEVRLQEGRRVLKERGQSFLGTIHR